MNFFLDKTRVWTCVKVVKDIQLGWHLQSHESLTTYKHIQKFINKRERNTKSWGLCHTQGKKERQVEHKEVRESGIWQF